VTFDGTAAVAAIFDRASSRRRRRAVVELKQNRYRLVQLADRVTNYVRQR
jgi:hypothetical protein